MKNKLRNKLIVTGALLTSLGFGSGCVFDIVEYNRQMEEKWANPNGYPPGYIRAGIVPIGCNEWANPNDPTDIEIKPKHTILTESGKYAPEPGYEWDINNKYCTKRKGQ